ncbi:hypothetical protein Droror1_Dr00024117 [Drosera rotundifolia]
MNSAKVMMDLAVVLDNGDGVAYVGHRGRAAQWQGGGDEVDERTHSNFLGIKEGYTQFGISRKGAEDISDQYCAIFFDKEKVELIEDGTFWLSESSSVAGSTSWGVVAPCIATWAISFSLFFSSLI